MVTATLNALRASWTPCPGMKAMLARDEEDAGDDGVAEPGEQPHFQGDGLAAGIEPAAEADFGAGDDGVDEQDDGA